MGTPSLLASITRSSQHSFRRLVVVAPALCLSLFASCGTHANAHAAAKTDASPSLAAPSGLLTPTLNAPTPDHTATTPTPTETPTMLAMNHPLYTSASLWNTPIPANPAIAPNNSGLIAAWADTTRCKGNCLNTQYDYT